jgi:hypothetical protein
MHRWYARATRRLALDTRSGATAARRYLDRRDIAAAGNGALRFNAGAVSYLGFKAGDQLPIKKDSVLNAGFEVVIAGKRYGKGSSREHSAATARVARSS